MQDQKDQSVNDIMIIALVLVGLLFIAQTRPVKLWTLALRASLDARIARAVGDEPGAAKLAELARSCRLVAKDKRYTIDLERAQASYGALVARRALTAKRIGVGVLSVAMLSLMGLGVWRAHKARRFDPAPRPDPKAEPLAKAKQALARRAPKWSAAISAVREPEELIELYAKIRETQNVPNNLIARAFGYGSPERRRLLDVGRGLSLDEERK